MKVAADREICMAAGMWVMTADEFFDQDDAGLVLLASDQVPAGLDTDVARRVQYALKLCPSGALQLVRSEQMGLGPANVTRPGARSHDSRGRSQ